MEKKETAGSLAIKAASDTTIYKSTDLAYGFAEEISKEIQECAERHCKIFPEGFEEFFCCHLIVSDPLIKNLIRNKFYAIPWLPKPRPDGSCYLFNRVKGTFKHLWTLPNPATMAELNDLHVVHKDYQRMKMWSDWFFEGIFWEKIRETNHIKHLSQEELQSNLKDQPKEASENNLMDKFEKWMKEPKSEDIE